MYLVSEVTFSPADSLAVLCVVLLPTLTCHLGIQYSLRCAWFCAYICWTAKWFIWCLGCLQTAEPELSGKLAKNIRGMLFSSTTIYKSKSSHQTKSSTPMHMHPLQQARPVQYSPASRFALWLVGFGGGRGGCLAGAFPFFLAWDASLLLWLVVVEAAIAFFGGSGAFLDLGLDLGSGGAWDAGISGQWSVVLSMDKKVNRSQLTQTYATYI